MVIVSDKYGNLGLGNRLFLFAHFIANAIEYDYTLSYPGFYEYANYFRSTEGDFFCRYPSGSSLVKGCKPVQSTLCWLLRKFTSWYSRLHPETRSVRALDIASRDDFEGDFDLCGPDFIVMREAARLLFVKGWVFRDERNIRRHAERVRRFFVPIEPHASNVSRLIERARKDCDILVGIHIRQGDYKIWLDGAYYYDTAEYANLMRQSVRLWEDKRVKFLVCSNEKQDEALFAGLHYTPGNGNQLEDMYAFAACDYLIGPPSSYTMWASFYGSVPLFVADAPDKPLTLEGFTIIEG